MATVVWLKTQVYNRSGFLPPFECYSSMEAERHTDVQKKTLEQIENLTVCGKIWGKNTGQSLSFW